MSNMILVTYDLNGAETSDSYKKLKKTIETSYSSNRKVLLSVYIIKTSETAKQVNEKLRKDIDDDDRLFCVEIKKGFWGGRLSQSHRDWLNE